MCRSRIIIKKLHYHIILWKYSDGSHNKAGKVICMEMMKLIKKYKIIELQKIIENIRDVNRDEFSDEDYHMGFEYYNLSDFIEGEFKWFVDHCNDMLAYEYIVDPYKQIISCEEIGIKKTQLTFDQVSRGIAF